MLGRRRTAAGARRAGELSTVAVFLIANKIDIFVIENILKLPVIWAGPKNFQWQKVKLAMAVRTTKCPLFNADIGTRLPRVKRLDQQDEIAK